MLEKIYTEDGRYIGVMRSRLDPIEPVASNETTHYEKGYYIERYRNIVKARDAYGGYGDWLERVHPEWAQ